MGKQSGEGNVVIVNCGPRSQSLLFCGALGHTPVGERPVRVGPPAPYR